jgi:multidrug resistance efflux pump
MNTPSSRLSLAFILAALIALSGCGKDQATPPVAPATASRYVAVARGSIDVEGGMLPLSSAVAGVVTGVDAHVGNRVHQGQTLATLDAGDARAALDIAKGKLEQAKAQAHMIALRLEAARHRAHTLAEAAAAGADAGQNAANAGNQASELAANQAAADAEVKVARGQLEQAKHALALHTLRAPVAAKVTQVQVQPGESVSPQSGPLFTLLPDAPRIVTAEVNSDFVGRIHKGMRAKVVLDNDIEHPVGMAHVTVVGQVFGPSTLEEDPSLRANIRTVKCRLRFDSPQSLRVGQRVLVRFLPDSHARH